MAKTPQEWSEFSPEDRERLKKRLLIVQESLRHWRQSHRGARPDAVALARQEIIVAEEQFYSELLGQLDIEEIKDTCRPTVHLATLGRVIVLVEAAATAAGGAIERYVRDPAADNARVIANDVIHYCLDTEVETSDVHRIGRRRERVENRVRQLLSSRENPTQQQVDDLGNDIARLQASINTAPARLRREQEYVNAQEAVRRAGRVQQEQQEEVEKGFGDRYGELVVEDGKKAFEVAQQYALPVGAGVVGGTVGAIASPTSFGALMTEAGLTGYKWSLLGGGLSVAAGVGAYALCRKFNVSKKASVAAGIGTAIATGVASTAIPIALLTVSIGGLVYMGWKAVQVLGRK